MGGSGGLREPALDFPLVRVYSTWRDYRARSVYALHKSRRRLLRLLNMSRRIGGRPLVNRRRNRRCSKIKSRKNPRTSFGTERGVSESATSSSGCKTFAEPLLQRLFNVLPCCASLGNRRARGSWKRTGRAAGRKVKKRSGVIYTG